MKLSGTTIALSTLLIQDGAASAPPAEATKRLRNNQAVHKSKFNSARINHDISSKKKTNNEAKTTTEQQRILNLESSSRESLSEPLPPITATIIAGKNEPYDPFLGMESMSMSVIEAFALAEKEEDDKAKEEEQSSASCDFCGSSNLDNPEGVRSILFERSLSELNYDAVIPNSVVPHPTGITCGTVFDYVSIVSEVDCSSLQMAESVCCPDETSHLEVDDMNTLPMSMSMRIDDNDISAEPISTPSTTSPVATPITDGGGGGDSTVVSPNPPTKLIKDGAMVMGMSSLVVLIATIVGLQMI
mmetsp:Transcript_32088/g.59301  ORF Transcript_32088/g.59301 Transcript_32088/m.59301 type:complete len:302 (+) Transcript_32088:110-1015(+)